MAAPLQDFAKVIRILLRTLRYASLLIVVVTAVVIGREVERAFDWCHEIHPILGWLFLVVFAALLGIGVVRPFLRFWRVPAALRQLRVKGRLEEAGPEQVALRLVFVRRYLETLKRNPLLAEQIPALDEAMERCGALRRRILAGELGDAAAARAALLRFETDEVEPFLRPLDERANQVIRGEAMAVGLATAIAWNGAVDALIVLWRNANLVARVATIYFGRPGVRGSLMILRDVSAAMFVASQMQGVLESAGGLFGRWFGDVVARPATEGGINALVTLRIGYVAKARCRAFRPWNDANVTVYIKAAMKEVSSHSAGVVKDLVATLAKSGLVKLPAQLAKKTGSFLGGLFDRTPGDQQPSTTG